MKDNPDHLEILRKINSKPNYTQRELAKELGFSLGKLNYCINALKDKGLFCIETRTTKDPIYGKGQPCGDHTFIKDNHKRRFIDAVEFREQVSKLGFKEKYFVEKNNLSIFKKDNPTLMRIILEK